MVQDIEAAMDKDIDTLDWMSAATKVRAKEKLHAVADKIGYPDHWRDYSSWTSCADDAFGNALRATPLRTGANWPKSASRSIAASGSYSADGRRLLQPQHE